MFSDLVLALYWKIVKAMLQRLGFTYQRST